MTNKIDKLGGEWGVYEVGHTPYRTDEVHVVPRHDDFSHVFTDGCECEPECRQKSMTDLPVYVHKVVYYN